MEIRYGTAELIRAENCCPGPRGGRGRDRRQLPKNTKTQIKLFIFPLRSSKWETRRGRGPRPFQFCPISPEDPPPPHQESLLFGHLLRLSERVALERRSAHFSLWTACLSAGDCFFWALNSIWTPLDNGRPTRLLSSLNSSTCLPPRLLSSRPRPPPRLSSLRSLLEYGTVTQLVKRVL